MTASHLRRNALALLCALGLPAAAQAREGRLRFEHLTMDQGLSNSFVQAIFKDSRGFLWIGTSEGLDRYDGSTPISVVYRYDPTDPESLPAGAAGVIFEDSRKRLWIGSGWVEGGFALFDRDRGRFKRLLPSTGKLGGNQALCMIEVRDGRLWGGTNNGLVEVDPDRLTMAQHPLGLDETSGNAGKTVRSLHEDRKGQLWVGTNAGLLLFDRRTGEYRTWASSNDTTGLGSAEIWAFYEQEDGGLWIATKSGLHRLDPATGQDTRYLPDPNDPTSISSARVTRLVPDGQGRLYVGTENGGLNILDLRTRKFTSYRPDSEDDTALNSGSVWSLFLDDQGILWIGTYDGGVNYISPLSQRFAYLRGRRGELSNPSVNSVMEDHLGNLWIGTGMGLDRMDQHTGAFRYYRDVPGAWTLVEDRQHRLWFGGWDIGIGLLDPESGRVTRFRHDPNRTTSIAANNVWRIVELRTGEMLVVLATGLDLFDRATGTFSRLTDRYPSATVDAPFSAAEDHDGNLWVVGRGVLFVDRQAGKTTLYRGDPKNPNDVPPGQVQAVYVDSAGNTWLGGEGGLTCVSAGTRRMRRFTTAEGLPNNWVNNIIEDAGGNLWVTHSRGLSKFVDALKLPDRPHFVNFTAPDGLQGYRFARNASFRGASGQLFFGGPRGLNSFVPDRVIENRTPPPIVITGIRLADKPQAVGAAGSPVTKPLHELERLRLSYRDSIVTFEYVALNYLLPQKNQYEFKLDGFDKDWRDAGSQRFATYTNLDPGEYTFHVLGVNNDGVPSDKPASLRVLITPPFYRTWPFYLLLAVLAVGSVVGTVRWRLSALETHRRELAVLVEQRTAALQTEVTEHKATEARLAGEVSERRRAEEEAHEYAKKLAVSNVELTDGQRALQQQQLDLERENEERRRAEEAASRERDLLHALMDNIPDLIYFKDAHSRFVRVNAAHAGALGLAHPEDAVGRTDQEYFPEEFARASLREEQELLQSGKPLLGKLEHESRSGRWYLATKVPLRDARGTITGLVGISRDITARRQTEERLASDLAAFQETVNAVAQGDLTRKGQEGADTVGQIARAVNAMIAGVSTIVAEVRDAAFSVSSSSSEILAAASEIAKGAEFGSDRVHSTSSSVEEMAASMTQVSRNASASAERARQVLEHVQQGDRAVDATYLGMTRIDAAVSQTAEKMRLLEQRSQEIFEIIGLIEEIASQSKLLSLNAAIEAAHAGDAGRGFGVVADEVRRLAESSTEATRNVSERIDAMLQEMETVRQATENAMREVRDGRTLSDQARQSLREISTLVQDSVNLASQISGASGEQVKATKTVAEAMQTIADVTAQSAMGAKETTKAVQDLVQLSERLTHAISRFQIDRATLS